MFEEYPDVLNFEQFRKSLGLGRNKAYELLHNKEIQHFRIGSYYKIPKIAVVNYINQQMEI